MPQSNVLLPYPHYARLYRELAALAGKPGDPYDTAMAMEHTPNILPHHLRCSIWGWLRDCQHWNRIACGEPADVGSSLPLEPPPLQPSGLTAADVWIALQSIDYQCSYADGWVSTQSARRLTRIRSHAYDRPGADGPSNAWIIER